MASEEVLVPIEVALDGISLRCDDDTDARHTLLRFLDVIRDSPDSVQAEVVRALMIAQGGKP